MRGHDYLLCWAVAALLLIGTGACPEGFVLEQNELGQNCRNTACDAGENLSHLGMTHDMAGMPLPQTGGWTIGAYQCPPDPLGIHPNPAWPCGFDYCPGAPRNIRVANMVVR